MSPTPGLAHTPVVIQEVTTESIRQGRATIHFVLAYQWIFTTIVGLLTIRNIALYIRRRYRRYDLILENHQALTEGYLNEKLGRPLPRVEGQSRVSLGAKVDSWLFFPLPQRWFCFGLENVLQALIFLVVLVINTGFITAVSTDFRGPEDKVWNIIHVVALRCGFMSFAQAPAVFALTGRNSLVQALTGIEYQHLRYVHKLLACTLGLLGVIHTLDATMAHAVWLGGAGVKHLYTTDYLGQTGLVMLAGFFLIAGFSIRRVRMKFYELFLITHIIGAILMVVGLRYHVPALRIWVYIPIGFWVFERVTRLLQMCSINLMAKLQFRAPLVRAHATLIEGAIVLRVPFKGTWKGGMHAYISFWDPSLARTPYIYGQTHPFSIANAPSSIEVDHTGRVHEMMFVMRTRNGMTNIIADKLSKSTNGSSPFLISVEGPYGHSVDTEQFHEILFVAGGSGISHIMSMLAYMIHKSKTSYSRVRKAKVVWTVQNVEQSIWTLTELLSSVKQAHDAGIQLTVELYVTRGMLEPTISRTDSIAPLVPDKDKPRRRRPSAGEEDLDVLMTQNPMANSLHVIPGRPPIAGLVPAFVVGSRGESLVVGCGPGPMMAQVRKQTNKLMDTHPVTLEIALFEC